MEGTGQIDRQQVDGDKDKYQINVCRPGLSTQSKLIDLLLLYARKHSKRHSKICDRERVWSSGTVQDSGVLDCEFEPR